MHKFFNVSGDCKPGLHYMVDLSSRLQKIKSMVDSGQYFTINRARQYGKTTTLAFPYGGTHIFYFLYSQSSPSCVACFAQSWS